MIYKAQNEEGKCVQQRSLTEQKLNINIISAFRNNCQTLNKNSTTQDFMENTNTITNLKTLNKRSVILISQTP